MYLLMCDFRGIFSCGTQQVVPSGQESLILHARIANHSAGFGLYCLLTELIILTDISTTCKNYHLSRILTTNKIVSGY